MSETDISHSLYLLASEMRRNSERWFPELHADPQIPLWLFYSIGTSSEAGEQLDVLKKVCRTPGAPTDEEIATLSDELADVFTYLMLLCQELDIDIIGAYEHKREHNEARWGQPGGKPASFREACVQIVNELGGASAREVRAEMNKRQWYPFCTIIDIADELQAHFGRRT